MKTISKLLLVVLVACGCLVAWNATAEAQRGRGGGGGGRGGGGGGHPSMGRVGAGGGRPSMGSAGGGRPAGGASHAASRPNINRPSMGHASPRPSAPSRPPMGSFNPSGSGRPNVARPATRPSVGAAAYRPSVRPPGNVNPMQRPSLPSGGLAGGNRPATGTRPAPGIQPGGGNRPNLGNVNRPTTLPGSIGRPGAGSDRPSLGNVNRPTTLPGSIGRPGTGGDRPNLGNVSRPTTLPGIVRPGGGGDRPIIGGGGNRPGRPGRPGNGNINIGNEINIGGGNVNVIGNRPGWDRPNWNNPGWGWGGAGWANNWHNGCINSRYGWYNGCWNGGFWGSSWYRPLAWGAAGWGLGSITSNWGYGTGFYNPYYVQPVATAIVPYDYSQPVVVNNYVSSDGDADGFSAQVAAETPESQQGFQLFDNGLALFKSGDYRQALTNFDAALQKLPGDPVVHEVRALTLFALGEYKPSAAALNSFLSSAPGMDWTTMSSLYGNVDDYKAQLRKLEQYCKSNPNEPAAHFVLAYHYLAIGSKDAAVDALRVVVKNQPKDVTAKRMLDALSPVEQQPAAAPTPTETIAGSDAPETDLVGNWRATAGDTTIDLSIAEDSQFSWKASQTGKPAVELNGQLSSTSDALVLESKDQGSMTGSVKSLGPDKWQFALSGAPPSDPGLSFGRIVK